MSQNRDEVVFSIHDYTNVWCFVVHGTGIGLLCDKGFVPSSAHEDTPFMLVPTVSVPNQRRRTRCLLFPSGKHKVCGARETGSASCRARVCQSVYISMVAEK